MAPKNLLCPEIPKQTTYKFQNSHHVDIIMQLFSQQTCSEFWDAVQKYDEYILFHHTTVHHYLVVPVGLGLI